MLEEKGLKRRENMSLTANAMIGMMMRMEMSVRWAPKLLVDLMVSVLRFK